MNVNEPPLSLLADGQDYEVDVQVEDRFDFSAESVEALSVRPTEMDMTPRKIGSDRRLVTVVVTELVEMERTTVS